MAQLPPFAACFDAQTSFGAAAWARNLLPRGQVEPWPDASHAINGEYPNEIAERAGQLWDDVDSPLRG